MTPDELRSTMRTLLDEERDALRRMDSEALLRATGAKAEVIERVRMATTNRAALVIALREFKDELRRNLVLLAHARDYLAEAIRLCEASGARAGRPRLAAKL